MKSRFPIVELGKHVRQVSQRNRDEADFEVFSVTNSEGFTKSTDYFSKEVFSKDVSKYKVVSPGQFAYNPSRINVGSIDYLRHDSAVLVSPLYIVFEGNKDLHADYLLRYLKSDWGNAQIRANTEGAVRDSLKFKGLENINLPLPPLDDQIRIAYLLGKVEGLIAQRKQHLQQLDDLLKSVFLEMFGDPVRNEKGWPVNPLATYMSEQPNNGLYKPQSSYGSGTKIIRIDSFYDGIVRNIGGLKRVEITNAELLKFEIRPFDVLVNRVNSIEYLGKIGVVPAISEPMVYESNIMRFRLNHEEMLPVYLMYFWRTPYLKSQINSKAKKAVNQASINQQDVAGLLVPQPSIELQRQFFTIVEKVEALKSRSQQSLTDLEALYGAMSQRAFKGELDLSRVAFPAAPIEGASPVAAVVPPPVTTQVIELPETDLLLPALQDRTQVTPLLRFWLEAYRTQLGSAAFSLERFIAAAQTRLGELQLDNAFELRASDYEIIKDWVFDALAAGALTQAFDDDGNRIELKAAAEQSTS